jgi:hypothetical protein
LSIGGKAVVYGVSLVALLKTALNGRRTRILFDFSIITLIATAVFRTWLFTNEWPAGGDIMGWISRSYWYKDMRWLGLWRPSSFGFVEGVSSMDFFQNMFFWVFNDSAASVKVFSFFLFLVAGFSIYAIAHRHTKKHLPSLFAALVYVLNQWFFSQLTEGHIDIIFSYALFPLVFLAVDRALQSKSLKRVLWAALALCIFLTGFHPEFVVIYGVFLVFFMLTALLGMMYPRFRNLGKVKDVLVSFTTVAVIVSLMSSFWLAPFVAGVRAPYLSPSYKYPIEEAAKISYPNIFDAIVLRAWEEWGYVNVLDLRSGISPLGIAIYPLLFVMFLSCLSVVFFRRDKYTVVFTLSILFSAVLASGPNSPFGKVFEWAWFNVPHFSVFRAASRWIAIAAFCYAMLVSILTDLLTSYIKTARRTKSQHAYFKKFEHFKRTEKVETYVPAVTLNKIAKCFRRLSVYLALSWLIMIPLFSLLSTSFFLIQGLQVYTPPESYLSPYNKIADVLGDYKVVTVSASPSEWMNLPYQESDFASGGMLTPIGWTHDLGFDSSFIHDEQTLQNGGWEVLARNFVDYLRFRLARQSLTKNMANLLGTFGYRFTVLPIYASSDITQFFLNQSGTKIVSDNGPIILENEFFTQHIFPADEYAIIIGGLEAFPSLCTVDSFKLNKTALIFADQINDISPSHTILSNSSALIFVNSDITDLVMLQLREKTPFICASAYALPSLNFTEYWASRSSWRTVGGFTLGGDTATTNGNTTLNVPFELTSGGPYDIWVRTGFSDGRGELEIFVDDVHIGKLRPSSSFWSGLKWTNITQVELAKGQHTIKLANDGTGYNDIDAIAVVSPALFMQELEATKVFLDNYSGRIVHLLQAESFFSYPQGYSAFRFPFEGYTLHSDASVAGSSSPEARLNVPTRDRYVIGVRIAVGPDYGKFNITVGDHISTIDCSSPTTEFRWFDFGPFMTDLEELDMRISVDGKIDLDEVISYSLKADETALGVSDLFSYSQNPVRSLTYEKKSAHEYLIHVNNTAPFLMIFSDSYHPLWKADVEGTTVSPMTAYYMVNGFYVNKSGELTILLTFGGEMYVDIGLGISAVTFAVALPILAVPSKAYSKIKEMLRKRQTK